MAGGVFEQITGVTLQKESENYTNMETYMNLRDWLAREHGRDREWIRTAWEFYFLPAKESLYSKEREEQFLVSVMETETVPEIYLKKRFRIGKYFSENSEPITVKQFKDLVQGQIEWMAERAEVLIQEFYQKIRLFSYKIGFMVESLREQYYLKEKNQRVTIDCFTDSQSGESLYQQKLFASPARVRVQRL